MDVSCPGGSACPLKGLFHTCGLTFISASQFPIRLHLIGSKPFYSYQCLYSGFDYLWSCNTYAFNKWETIL